MHDPLLDRPSVNATRFAELEDRVAALLGTSASVVLLQAEATLALEAAARGVASPGVTVLNVVSGPYGGLFGSWLRSAGATVVELPVPFDATLAPEQLDQILSERPDVAVVSLAHAEAATGNKNPLPALSEVTRQHGVLLVVDAVASVGAEPLSIDAWGIDLCVLGPQKALAGPNGISMVTVSTRAWSWMESNHQAPRQSALSLLDWKHDWIDRDRANLPVIPATLELLALEAAVQRVNYEGLASTIARHRAAATAVRGGLRALGLEPWVENDDSAAHVVTTVRTPMRRSSTEVHRLSDPWRPSLISLGIGNLAEKLVRVNHTGLGADPAVATDSLEDLFAIALGRRPRAGAEAKRLVKAQRVALDLWDRAMVTEAADAHDAVAACP
jgi:aspartate aminotransferase-like enzyme